MLARLFVFFGGLLVLALTAALVGPYFIDWTNYRAEFEHHVAHKRCLVTNEIAEFA